MAPIPYQLEPAPSTFAHLLCIVWCRLYSDGDEPVYQDCWEQLADPVYEYHTKVVMYNSTLMGTYTRSTKGELASSPDQAVQFAAFEALIDLHYNEIQMQTHQGFYYYPSMFDTGRIRFPIIDPECGCSTSHHSCYITAGHLLIHNLSQELNRTQEALAATRSAFTPPSLAYAPLVPSITIPPPTPVTPQSNSETSTVTPHESPADWALLLATPAAPMPHSHPTHDPEGEPSCQCCRVSIAPEVSVNIISFDSESETEETPAEPSEFQCDHCLHE
jgi:hypothetical protein